MTKNFEM
jgi:hypothetical protein